MNRCATVLALQRGSPVALLSNPPMHPPGLLPAGQSPANIAKLPSCSSTVLSARGTEGLGAGIAQWLDRVHTAKSFQNSQMFTNLFHKPNVIENAKTWHDAHNMAQKSSTKVRNSSTHLLKGSNPYCVEPMVNVFLSGTTLTVCSRWPTYSYQSKHFFFF